MYFWSAQVTEVPLVFDDASESISKTSAAVKLLQTVSRLFKTCLMHHGLHSVQHVHVARKICLHNWVQHTALSLCCYAPC